MAFKSESSQFNIYLKKKRYKIPINYYLTSSQVHRKSQRMRKSCLTYVYVQHNCHVYERRRRHI